MDNPTTEQVKAASDAAAEALGLLRTIEILRRRYRSELARGWEDRPAYEARRDAFLGQLEFARAEAEIIGKRCDEALRGGVGRLIVRANERAGVTLQPEWDGEHYASYHDLARAIPGKVALLLSLSESNVRSGPYPPSINDLICRLRDPAGGWTRVGAGLMQEAARAPLEVERPAIGEAEPDAGERTATGDGVSIDAAELEILRGLKATEPVLQTTAELEAATGISRKTVGDKLATLIEFGLASRPRGKSKGATTTADGSKLVDRLDRAPKDDAQITQ